MSASAAQPRILPVNHRLKVIEDQLRPQPYLLDEFAGQRDLVREVLELQAEKQAILLGHNYMHPLVYHISEVANRGDSLGLSQQAARCKEPVIVFNGVRFMAETAKILNPDKLVLIPDLEAGCSLADNFLAEDVREYRRRYPGLPVVTYINSYAEVKAETEYCCTSANAVEVVRAAAKDFGVEEVIFLPDTLMGMNLQREFNSRDEAIRLIYPGRDDDRFTRCEVHEQFTAQQIRAIRLEYDLPRGGEDTAVLVHWECSPEVLEEADYCGSTSQMARFIADRPHLKRVYLATECEMAANLAAEFPTVHFVRSCSFHCPHMRRITLEKLRDCLLHEQYAIDVDSEVASRARLAIDRMLAIGR